MKTLNDYSTQELKLIYHLLHLQLPVHKELLDSKFLQDLQQHLLQQAAIEGINVSQQTDWAMWLNSGN